METPQIPDAIKISIKMFFPDVQSKFFSILLVLASTDFELRLFLLLFQQLTIIFVSSFFVYSTTLWVFSVLFFVF